jgi:hypothetical protein
LPGPRIVNIVRKRISKTVREWEHFNGATRCGNIFLVAGMIGLEFEGAVKRDMMTIYAADPIKWGGEDHTFLSDRFISTRLEAYNPHRDTTPNLVGFKSDSPPLSILFVCRESFHVASQFY